MVYEWIIIYERFAVDSVSLRLIYARMCAEFDSAKGEFFGQYFRNGGHQEIFGLNLGSSSQFWSGIFFERLRPKFALIHLFTTDLRTKNIKNCAVFISAKHWLCNPRPVLNLFPQKLKFQMNYLRVKHLRHPTSLLAAVIFGVLAVYPIVFVHKFTDVVGW